MRARNSALRVARPCTSNPFAVANVICFTLNPSPLCPALRPRRGRLVQCFLKQRQLVRDKRDSIDARVAHLYLTAVGEREVSAGPVARQNDLLSTLEHLSANTL